MIPIKRWTIGLFKLLPSAISLLLAANCQLPTANCQLPCREVIGYYPSWKFYDRQQLVNPATIDYSKYTILNYAFFEPRPDGSVVPFDPRTDKLILLGEIDTAAPPGYARRRDFGQAEWHVPGTSLVDKAHEHGVKVFVSIGGWTLSQYFSRIAASSEKRRRFAHSCAEMVHTYNLDGIDLDWEYPGYRSNGGGPDDQENFTLLLREIRDSLDALQPYNDRQLYLSAAFGCAPTRMEDIEWGEVTHLLDFINMMTYDFYGRDFSVTNHNAPLYPPAKGINGFDLHSTIHHLMEYYGVPPEKICIGVPFYGRAMKTRSTPGLHVGSMQSMDSRTFAEDAGSPTFYNILAKKGLFFYDWDSIAQAPYLRSKSTNTFVTFDDERSVAQKARYILDHGLAGAIVWDITGDCVESPSQRGIIERTPLADALKAALCNELLFWEETSGLATIGRLPPLEWFVQRQVNAPRVLTGHRLSKKEKRKMRRKMRRQQRNRDNSTPGKYFDGGH
ncbi:MAG: glycoside hydrolase family 18 protein [Saprospiraceae bacterium]|nr:glycoside hydrolase family 18 protein [Saprospiraceae bacterium]MCF8250869.1 glycoside hydrolase family 18 protein [Saprospiraceae bacterium]MCF8281125.1 glycoside hydrolase family 18 protein [Bacteroidales bacterium]MCF8312730.1 glycoside hydrolase family 18 protein [Saprospiraceae bacterium]MCF8441177.1 glycoside hydrolase family 18 protein [Saprospiraceae bacterium]